MLIFRGLIMKKTLKKCMKYLLKKCNVLCTAVSKMGEKDARKCLNEFSTCPQGTCSSVNKIDIEYDLQIVVPAYNAEKYVRECLDSIMNQKTQYRVLVSCVNDGSTDNTAVVLAEIPRKIGNIELEVMNQKNRGYSGARNAALKVLKGQYIYFVDSDDVLPDNTIEKLLDAAYETDADILQGSWYTFSEGVKENNIVEREGILEDNRGAFSGYPWGKLFKYTVLEKFRFPEGYWFEDTPISFILAALPLRFAAVKEIVYGYRLNPEGITAKAIYNKKSVDSYWITEQCLKEFPKFFVGDGYNQRAYEYLLRQSVMNYWRTKKQPRKVRESIFVLTSCMIEKYFPKKTTTNNAMRDIEKALNKKQFLKYELLVRCLDTSE